MDNPEHVGVATVYIDLENWNDELPIFGTDVYTVSFKETVPAGYYIGNLTAHDRDIGDRVEWVQFVLHSMKIETNMKKMSSRVTIHDV